MSKRETIRKEVQALHDEGAKLGATFQENEEHPMHYDYQHWYTKALKVIASLAPDRQAEFRGYYEIDPKRKGLRYGTFVIQDFLKGDAPGPFEQSDFDGPSQALRCFFNQLAILQAVADRVDSVLDDIEGELYATLQDDEIVIARQLSKVSHRAAGALVGVVIEGHLKKVVAAHGVRIAKKNPTIADLNGLLKTASVINTPAWRKISYLADLRNLCSHKKNAEPTREQVEELIQGAEWLAKNVF